METTNNSSELPTCAFFSGIGGCGMSGLAALFASRGIEVHGSDCQSSDTINKLKKEGIKITLNQDGKSIPNSCDMVITSAAIPLNHPERIEAEKKDILVLNYAEALGRIQSQHTAVCIAGTHGKSTTASMLCHILLKSGLDPSFIVGANCHAIGGSSRLGKKQNLRGSKGLLVSEACEFNRSFHKHRPKIGLIHNIEEDHLDVYGSLESIIESFKKFAELIPPRIDGGRLLISHENAYRTQVAANLPCIVETYGFNPESDWQVAFDPNARRTGLLRDGMWTAHWSNKMPGSHNALNAAAAAILSSRLGAEWDSICTALESFDGVERRMQRLGTVDFGQGPAIIYDDYAHHPTEIDHTLRALRAWEKPRKLFCVFQPHQHSRTRFLLESFSTAFNEADEVIVPNIYFVRDSERDRQSIEAKDLVKSLISQGTNASFLPEFNQITDHIKKNIQEGDLLVVMGAGSIWKIAHSLFNSSEHLIN